MLKGVVQGQSRQALMSWREYCAGLCHVVVVVRHARRQFRGQSSLRAPPVQQSCWQPTEQQSAERAKPACCIAPPPCVACPPAFLAPVGRLRSRAHAGKRCSAHYRANTVPSPLPVCIQARGAR